MESFCDARTEIRGSALESFGRRLDTGFPRPKGTRLDRLMTVVVDDGIPEDTIEPRICGLVGLKGMGVGDRLEAGHLQDIFGGAAVVDPALNEAQETATLLYQICHGRGHLSDLDAVAGEWEQRL